MFFFFSLPSCSSWGIRDKTCLPGCALRWPCSAFCSHEMLSSLAWEESRDEGTSCWSLPQPLAFPQIPRGGARDRTLWGGTVRWNTGLDFLFSNWIWRRDEENTGHRWTEANYRLFSFFVFCFFVFLFFSSFPRRSHCVWRDIFEIFVRLPILYSKLLFLFGISSLEGPPSVRGMPYSLLPQYDFFFFRITEITRKRSNI